MLEVEPEIGTEFVDCKPRCIGRVKVILCLAAEPALEQPDQLSSSRVQRVPVDKKERRWDLVPELVEPGHNKIHAGTHAHVLKHERLVGNETVVRISRAIEQRFRGKADG